MEIAITKRIIFVFAAILAKEVPSPFWAVIVLKIIVGFMLRELYLRMHFL